MKSIHPAARPRQTAPRKRFTSALSAFAVVVASALGVAASAETANALSAGDGINYTLEGCRNNGGITLPNSSGDFVCPDSAYTTGNLGKGWNELDLVPMRVTVSAGNSAPATQTFAFALVVDNMDAGKPGYDVLSSDSGGTPVLNSSLSNGTCGTLSAGAPLTTTNFGGIDQSLYRILTVTGQAKNSTCVYDAFARLALGSHLFPGSALHFNLANDELGTAGVGSKEVSIPVKEILPQELSKDMSATQGSDHAWDVTKSPTPATLAFTNTCDPAEPLSAAVNITVSWTKQAATPSGPITVITHVYAKNPAARVITVNVTDSIRSGTTELESVGSGAVDVPANTANFLVLTHTTTVPAGTTDLNDVATATYTDKVTGIAVPGTTQASASATVQLSGPELNQSAVVNDTESITGTGLTFSVDSTTGATGSFDGGYVAGTHTTGPVSWTSAVQSGSGSVTFHKTVYATAATIATGSLADTAVLTGSDGFTKQASASVTLSTNATVSLGVSKTTSLNIAAAQLFTFHLFNGANSTGDTTTVTIPANSNGPVSSAAISGLDPAGTYSFHEDATAPYPAQTTGTKTFSLVAGDRSSCSGTIPVTNTAPAATARVKKDTVPESTGNWTMTLTGPGGLSETLTNVQAGSGYAAFAADLDVDGGSYTITETQQTGYDLTGVTGDFGGVSSRVTTSLTSRTCSFTLDLTTDSGKVFSCAFVNTKRARIIVQKITSPASTQQFGFTTNYSDPFSLQNGQSNDSGLLVPGSYNVAETAVDGWDNTSATCDGTGNTPASITLLPGATVTCIFVNTQRGAIIVKKVTDPANSAETFGFSGDATGTIGNGQTIVVGNLPPGTYTSTEAAKAGWDLTNVSCDDSASATASSGSVANRKATFKLDPGETVTCTFTNRQRGSIIVKKVTQPSPSSATFGFTGDATGTIGDGGTITVSNLVPGTYTSTEATKAGWDLTNVSCDDSSSATASTGSVANRTATFKLDPGETVTCTFTNRQRGHVSLVKTVNGAAPSGDQAFTFQLRQGASPTQNGTTLETQVANAANGGSVAFTTELVPGDTYQFCEIVMPGWLTNLGTFVPNSFIPPDGVVANPNVDNSILCVNFTVTAGETKTFTVDNTPPPGGRALTIGFWKNWASCASSNGKQKPVLDDVLATFPIATGQTTHGVYIGDLYVDTCSEAVALLNKTTLSGKKMASDPLYNMAAQLMAAVLNFQAGAGKCSSAVNAVNQAQALLVKYHFNGNTYSPKLTTADANLANQLATTLDRYNNNLLC